MSKREKFGQEFRITNKNHSCGIKPASVDKYIAAQSEDVQPILIKIRETILAAAPNATEEISWEIPAFHQVEDLIIFKADKNSNKEDKPTLTVNLFPVTISSKQRKRPNRY